MVYTCNICNKEFVNLTDYTRHCKRKISCDPKLKAIGLTCSQCNKHFTDKSNLNRHIKTMHKPVKSDDNKLIDSISNELPSSSQDVSNTGENSELLNAVNNGNENNAINGNDNVAKVNSDNITFNIHIYGNENTSYITPEMMKEVIDKQFTSVIEYIKLKHFNMKHKENFNFHLLDKVNHKYTMVKKENTGIVDWDVEETEEFVHTLLLDTICQLDEYITANSIEANTKGTIKIDKMKNIIENYDKEEEKKKDYSKYNEYLIDIIKLSIKYLDHVIAAKKEEQLQKEKLKEKDKQENIIKSDTTVKKPRGRPRKL